MDKFQVFIYWLTAWLINLESENLCWQIVLFKLQMYNIVIVKKFTYLFQASFFF